MTTDTSEDDRILLGLLECPLRRGYIEFEYRTGDTIDQLQRRLSQTWGQPDAIGRRPDHNNWHGGLTDRGAWAILCEDESGAYVALSTSSEIPQAPPTTSKELRAPWIPPNPSSEWNLPAGLIYDTDVRETFHRMLLPEEPGEKQPEEPGEKQGPHLNLGFAREYEVPGDKEYCVRLLALVVITGG